jgi:fucose permease
MAHVDRATSSPYPSYLLTFIVLGVSLSTVGPALPHLREQAGIGLGAGGTFVAAQGIGYVSASLLTGRLLDHHGAGHRFLLGCCAGAIVGVTALSFVADLWLLSIAFVVIGASAGGIDVAANTLLAWHEEPAQLGTRLNGLHLRFGIGAILAPLAVAASLAVRDDLLLVSALLIVLLAGSAWRLRGIATPVHHRRHDADRAAANEGAAPARLGMAAPGARALIALGAAFFILYIGAEGGFGAWSTTYGEDIDLGLDVSAALLTAVYWGGFTLGRIAAVVLARTQSVDRLVTTSCAAATAFAVALTLLDGIPAATWVIVALLGFSLGPQYASMLAAIDRRIGLDGRITSLLVGAAGAGGLVIPVAIGWLLDRSGVELLPLLTAICIGAAWLAAHLVVRRRSAAVPAVIVPADRP